ncbi:hypothetical protein TomMM35A_27220 [Sphingobium sp. TomMM35A]
MSAQNSARITQPRHIKAPDLRDALTDPDLSRPVLGHDSSDDQQEGGEPYKVHEAPLFIGYAAKRKEDLAGPKQQKRNCERNEQRISGFSPEAQEEQRDKQKSE